MRRACDVSRRESSVPLRVAAAAIAIACLGHSPGLAQPTPPIIPKIEEPSQPPSLELPPPSAWPSEVPNRPLTAQEAADLALHLQPSISEARAGILGAEGVEQQAKSQLKPLVSVGTSYNQVRTFRPSGGGGAPSASDLSRQAGGGGVSLGSLGLSAAGFRVSTNVQQLIFDFNHTRDLVRQAEKQTESAEVNLTRVQADLVLQVKEAFYIYLQSLRLVRVNQENIDNQREHVALARARLQTGLGLPYDLVRAETALANAMYGLTAAQATAAVARVNLAQLIGVDPRTPVEAAEEPEPALSTDDVGQLVVEALERRPEMRQAQADVDAARHGLQAARTSTSPLLAGTFSWFQTGDKVPPPDATVVVGLSVQWEPFDLGARAGGIKRAQADVQTAEASMALARLAVTSDVSQAYLDLKAAEQKVVTAAAELANAEENLRLARGRYRSGLGVFIDVIDAESAFVTASTNGVNAASARDQARAVLRHAVGAEALPAAAPLAPQAPTPGG